MTDEPMDKQALLAEADMIRRVLVEHFVTTEIGSIEELNALPVGSVVKCTWYTWENTSQPFGEMTKPVSRLFMVTEHMLVAERYEMLKRYALPRCTGGIRLISRPDTSR